MKVEARAFDHSNHIECIDNSMEWSTASCERNDEYVIHYRDVTVHSTCPLQIGPRALRIVFQAEDGIRYHCVTGVQTGAFFFSSRRRHTRSLCDWSSDVCSSD